MDIHNYVGIPKKILKFPYINLDKKNTHNFLSVILRVN